MTATLGIGAIVGVQPFGGRGASATDPKEGGSLYLGRSVGQARETRDEDGPLSESAAATSPWLSPLRDTARTNRIADVTICKAHVPKLGTPNNPGVIRPKVIQCA